jgi:hypothetical protein
MLAEPTGRRWRSGRGFASAPLPAPSRRRWHGPPGGRWSSAAQAQELASWSPGTRRPEPGASSPTGCAAEWSILTFHRPEGGITPGGGTRHLVYGRSRGAPGQGGRGWGATQGQTRPGWGRAQRSQGPPAGAVGGVPPSPVRPVAGRAPDGAPRGPGDAQGLPWTTKRQGRSEPLDSPTRRVATTGPPGPAPSSASQRPAGGVAARSRPLSSPVMPKASVRQAGPRQRSLSRAARWS